MEKLDWKAEIADIEKQIYVLSNKSHIPLLVLEEFDKNENMDKIKLAYEALDRAQMSLIKNRIMKAISELNEAKFNLENTKIGAKFIKEIDNKIKSFQAEIKKTKEVSEKAEEEKKESEESEEISADMAQKYMERCKRAEKRLRFDRAIEFALKAIKIFGQLGPEWNKEQNTIAKYIDSLKRKKEVRMKREVAIKHRKEEIEKKEVEIKKEEDEFKSRIASRREARRKKINELIEKK